MIAGDYYDGKWEQRTSFIVTNGDSLYTAIAIPENIFETLGHKDSTWAQLTFNFVTNISPKEDSKPQINLYPNPATSHIKLNTTLPIFKVQVSDSKGRFFDVNLNSDYSIDISLLPTGIYTITANTSKSIIHSDFIKVE